MQRLRGILASTTAIVVLCMGSTARADDHDPSTQARTLRDAAADAASKKDFETCRSKAAEAFALVKEPQAAGLLGLCEAELHLWRNAAEHLDYGLEFDPKPERKAAYQVQFDEAKKHVGSIKVSSTPETCTIRIDVDSLGDTPKTIYVNPGHYVIEAHKDGYKPGRNEVDVLAGGVKDVRIALAPEHGEVEKRSFAPAIVAYGVGAVGLGLGIGFFAAHGGQKSSAEKLSLGRTCTKGNLAADCQDLLDAAKKANTSGNASTAGFIVGAAGIGVGTGLLIWALTAPKHAEGERAVMVVPMLGPTTNGVTLQGRF